MPKKLISWSKKNFSHLPWRENRSLYRTLVSEIMLQQTTVGTVLNHFEKFLVQFPNIKSLASATEEELLIAWKGLGYYRRAKNLKKIADQVLDQYNGKIPESCDELIALNGVGPYTASAIMSIGLDKRFIAVDANLERVISRLFRIKIQKGPKLTKYIYDEFEKKNILNFKNISFREFNEALMDLGRTYCKSMTVECQNCPMSEVCESFKKRDQLNYPLQDSSKKKEFFELQLLRVVVKKSNQVLAYEKNEKEWLHGQWELPTFILNSMDEKLVQYPTFKSKIDLKNVIVFKTNITKYKITNYVVELSLSEFKKISKDEKYKFKQNTSNSNFSTSTIKALNKII